MSAYSQDLTPPEKPELKYVSIDTLTNNVDVFWTASPSADVKWYNLYYEANTIFNPGGVLIDSIDGNQISYTHIIGGDDHQSLLYSISAEDSSGNESLRTPGLHSTIYTKLKYDSCLNYIKISWNKYIGWENNVSGYVVYGKKENSPFEVLAGLSATDSSYIQYAIEENTNYSYFVEAIKNDGLISRSNISTKYTYMPGPPELLVLDFVTISKENTAEIHFHYTDTSSIHGFSLLRSSVKDSDFESVHQFFYPDQNSYILENSLISSTDTFYYKIRSLNTCREKIWDSNLSDSNLGVNIVLSGVNNGLNNILKWNEYLKWDTGVEEYQLYRMDNSGEMVLLESLNSDTRIFNDLLSDPSQLSIAGELIYQIKAKKVGEEIYSASNLISIAATTDLFMPNAFTPNGDLRNDVFLPVVRFAPEKFKMIIYDRAGFPVFQSDNIELGWDGRIRSNEMAPQGVYIYHIQYTSFNGSIKSDTGTLTVFYP